MKLLKALKFSLFSLVFLTFFSCATDLTEIDVYDDSISADTAEPSDSSTSEPVVSLKAETFSLSNIIDSLKINSDVGEVTLNDIEGKKILVVSQNNSDKTISTGKAMTIATVASAGRAAISEKNSVPVLSEKKLNEIQGFESVSIKPVDSSSIKLEPASSRAAVSGDFSIGSQLKVGSEKEIFLDSNEGLTKFESKRAVLRYSGRNCNIWSVVNEPILDAVSMKKLAETFDRFYVSERSVFGEESNKIYVYNGSKFVLDDLTKHSDWGNKINIVVYNISKENVIGYFHNKDYYQSARELLASRNLKYTSGDAANYSNAGKFIYLNYRYASGEKNNPNYEFAISEQNKRLAESTLIHEFQHMINFSVKGMKGLNSADWYNEMLSMLAEDMFASQIGTGEKAPAVMRMSTFQNHYFKSGLTEFKTSYAYGTAYAFGAWLVRNFGGVDFIKIVMNDGLVNEASVLDAVNALSPKKYTFDDLFDVYVKDCINSTGFDAITSPSENYVFDFSKIKTYPIVKPVGKSEGMDIGPYGFVVREIETNENSLTLSLSQRTKAETVHIIVK
ncbi:MAG: hypothetical protein KBT11_06290 [Treponema sp.]|nr:hypothetical protein [Candidatus Treponema equifaecale]